VDIFEFQDRLEGILGITCDGDEIRIMYEAATKMLGHERDARKVAATFIKTAHILMLTADETDRGFNTFKDLLESELAVMGKVKTKTDLQKRTRAIEQA